MSAKKSGFPDDKTERERRKNLSESQIKELELAGGAEGGMQAGSAGGPGERDAQAKAQSPSEGSPRRKRERQGR
jgi:hypothetical protein